MRNNVYEPCGSSQICRDCLIEGYKRIYPNMDKISRWYKN